MFEDINIPQITCKFEEQEFSNYQGDKETFLENMKQDMRERILFQAREKLTDGRKYIVSLVESDDFFTQTYSATLYVFLTGLQNIEIGEFTVYNAYGADERISIGHEIVNESGELFSYIGFVNGDDIWRRIQ